MLQEFNYKQLCGEKEENLLKKRKDVSYTQAHIRKYSKVS